MNKPLCRFPNGRVAYTVTAMKEIAKAIREADTDEDARIARLTQREVYRRHVLKKP